MASLSLLVVLCAWCVAQSLHNSRLHQIRNYNRKTITSSANRVSLHAVKADLFSDDLFDDDDDKKPMKKDQKEKEDEGNKRKYLDQKWKLNAEDAKDFKGFPTNDDDKIKSSSDDTEPATKVPVFALMYKFRKEYLDVGVDSMMADHKGHCSKFKRLVSSELIHLGKAKGVVLLWAGFTDSDKTETRADIMSFLEEDPLIVKDAIDNWDIIDLANSNASSTATLPSASAGKAA